MTTILFGSISTIADTSELQRDAFNAAFKDAGLDWEWSQDEYRELLVDSNGGRDRVADYAAEKGVEVDADAVHATKSRIFQERVADAGVTARPGVVDVIAAAKSDGARVGLVTTTLRENIDALLAALPDVGADDFAVITDMTDVEARKPAGDVYEYAVAQLGTDAGDCIAIEDNPGGAQSASAAGVAVIAFPNANTSVLDFGATREVDALDYAKLAAGGNGA